MVRTAFPPSHSSLTEPQLQLPIQYLKGVGPHRAQILSKLGIHTVEDLLYHYPKEHQNRRVVPISSLYPGIKGAIQGTVIRSEIRRLGTQLGQAKALIRDSSGTIEAVWFKFLSYKFDVFSGLKKDLKAGNNLCIYGSIDLNSFGFQIKVEEHEFIETGGKPSSLWDSILPLYRTTEGVSEKWLRQLIHRWASPLAGQIVEYLPETVLKLNQLPPISECISQYHFPSDWKNRDQARERLAFDEFFLLELTLMITRQNRQQEKKGFIQIPSRQLLTPFKNNLQFQFTAAQKKAINEIFLDMGQSVPMNRLLQGDVGSGKTIVALSACLLAIENGRQAAILAPTEILAEQHAMTFEKFLGPLKLKWSVLTRSTPKAERKSLLNKLKQGKIQLLIGTHAILNEEVEFQQLGLVVIDEQHRFGVRQRSRLISKANPVNKGWIDQLHPDVLIMTATPIPRTLALTLYGDLDVSVINEYPANRKSITTQLINDQEALTRIREKASKNEKVFVVTPLIDEKQSDSPSSSSSPKAATTEFMKLKNKLSSFKIGLLHGQMSGEEKRKVMDEFRNRDMNILVSTTVIEVGIDVPAASLIIIMNPERFGLAQLHQLRGRVGRGKYDSDCCLVISYENQTGLERLQMFSQTRDGFKLAEEDLKLRGPGEILGEAQHGLPFFKVANLVSDALLIQKARNTAKMVVEGQIPLTMGEFQKINRILKIRFGDKIQLSSVG